MDTPDFASLLRRYRRRSGRTQEELAEQAGLSPAAVSLLERGITLAPQRATIGMLSTALGLSPDEAADFQEQARGSRHGVTDGDEPAPATTTGGSHLPIPLTPLIGREAEAATLLDLLQRATTRLLTLTGPAGVGKTRLALELAARLRNQSTPGSAEAPDAQARAIIFVGLIPVREPRRVLPAIALALEIQESTAESIRDALIRHLHDREVVLVLDNFEQVLPAARAVLELLVACPRLRALVTSRSALNVRGERIFPLAPLALPTPEQSRSPEELRQVPTVALFLDRASALWPELTATNLDDIRLIAAICERLDGLPLAIELAAARAHSIGLRQLHDRLAEPTFLSVLAEGAQDLADHQRTMRSTIAWSYDLLSEEQQRLFRWLGVFVGGATIDAVEAVTGMTDDTLLANLTALINASLLKYSDDGVTRRYTQLVTLQSYAQEQLRATGEWESARRRHAEFYLGLAQLSFEEMGNWRKELVHRLESDYENVRVTLAWALEMGETAFGLRMLGALWRFASVHSSFAEYLDWAEHFITRAGAPASDEEHVLLANAWTGVMVIAYRMGRFERACEAGEQALALRREIGDKALIASALMNLGNTVGELRDFDRALALYHESIALFEEVGNRQDLVFPLMNLGNVYYKMNMPHEALKYQEQSIALSHEVGEIEYARGLTWNNIAETYIVLDEPARAIEVAKPAYKIFIKMRDVFCQATTAFTLARAEWRRGNMAAACTYLDEAQQLFEMLGNLATVARIHYFRASFALSAGDVATARDAIAQGIAVVRRLIAQTVPTAAGMLRATEHGWWLVERSATLAHLLDEPSLAARLYAAGTTHRDALIWPVEPAERALQTQDHAWLVAILGDEALASMLANGQALSLDDALEEIEQALRDDTTG